MGKRICSLVCSPTPSLRTHLGPNSEKRDPGIGPVCSALTVGGWRSRPRASRQGHWLLQGVAGTACRHRPLPLTHGPAIADLPLSLLVKEEEKQKLLQRGSELQSEHQQLQERDRRLAGAVQVGWRGACCP